MCIHYSTNNSTTNYHLLYKKDFSTILFLLFTFIADICHVSKSIVIGYLSLINSLELYLFENGLDV